MKLEGPGDNANNICIVRDGVELNKIMRQATERKYSCMHFSSLVLSMGCLHLKTRMQILSFVFSIFIKPCCKLIRLSRSKCDVPSVDERKVKRPEDAAARLEWDAIGKWHISKIDQLKST